jgi:hypothetical protein
MAEEEFADLMTQRANHELDPSLVGAAGWSVGSKSASSN